jgi:hypothetical protein
VRWTGVTDDKMIEWLTLLHNPKRDYVLLYAPDNKEILGDHELVHCRILAEQCVAQKTATVDWNIITAYFEQVVG